MTHDLTTVNRSRKRNGTSLVKLQGTNAKNEKFWAFGQHAQFASSNRICCQFLINQVGGKHIYLENNSATMKFKPLTGQASSSVASYRIASYTCYTY